MEGEIQSNIANKTKGKRFTESYKTRDIPHLFMSEKKESWSKAAIEPRKTQKYGKRNSLKPNKNEETEGKYRTRDKTSNKTCDTMRRCKDHKKI